jgi:LCP family protein required for cell wall assembly
VTTSTSDAPTPWVARPSRGRTAALVVFAAVVAATAVVAGAVWWVNASVDRVGVEGLGEGGLGSEANASDGGAEPGDAALLEDQADARALTVLVLGSDSRDVLTEEERRELGTGYAEGERTEVVALTRLDPAAGEVRVLSVPRDSLVRRCDGSAGRVNAAYGIGEREEEGTGLSCVVETLRSWLGVRIDHVVKVDFRGFVDIVDAVGGVEMFIEEPLRDRRANLDLEAGCQRLDGAQALAFVRARSIDDDFGRMQRQHRFVAALRDELASQGVLTDLPRLLRVAEATARAVELDDSLTLGRIQQLARQHRGTIQGDIDARSIPGVIERIDGIDFLRVDEQRAQELSRWLVTGRDVADLLGGGDGTGQDGDEGGTSSAPGEGRDGHGAGEPGAGSDIGEPDAGSGTSADAEAGSPDRDEDAPPPSC